jgi:hypothetical protein
LVPQRHQYVLLFRRLPGRHRLIWALFVGLLFICVGTMGCATTTPGQVGPNEMQSAARTLPCEEMNFCIGSGECVEKEGRCVAVSNDDCKQSQGCEYEGVCHVRKGVCEWFVGSGGSCDQPMGKNAYNPCKERGRCTAKDGFCVAATDSDCEQSSFCTHVGYCVAKNDICVIGGRTDAECDQPRGSDGFNPCEDYGYCTVRDGQCIAANTADCQKASGCRFAGVCTAAQGRCVIGGDADCLSNSSCKMQGKCTAIDGVCVYGGATSSECDSDRGESGYNPCRAEGFCTARYRLCIAASNADCRKSGSCYYSGYCTAVRGKCVAGTDADCLQSAGCKNSGLCTLVDGACEKAIQ